MDEKLKKQIEDEGNRFEFEEAGLKCLGLRHPRLLHWCGYVKVPKDSILFRKQKSYYYTESENGISEFEQTINNINVHGGITYVGKRENDDDIYWGFDCGHLGDDSPGLDEMIPGGHHKFDGDTYKDKEYVMEEVKSLAKQLSEIIKKYD